MGIDWFTLAAQVVNFLVLVGLLRYFLYGPIVRAMNEREAKIAARLEEAAALKEEAERELAEYRGKVREFEGVREEMLAEARRAADELRARLAEEARAETERLRKEWRAALRQERDALLADLRRGAGERVCAIARRALADLAGEDLQRRMAEVFLGRLARLPPEQRAALARAILDSEREVVIHSGMPMAPEEEERLARAVREELAEGAAVRFEVSPELICGIELRAHSHRLGWSLESYLADLEENFYRLLEAPGAAGLGPAREEEEPHGRAVESGR